MKTNMDIRWMARVQGVPLLRLAKRMGMSEATLYRRLNGPLDPQEKQRFLQAIAEDAAAQNTNNETKQA